MQSVMEVEIRGSHRTSFRDERVIIHDLELFSGFDPSIDTGEDEHIAAMDESAIDDIIIRTQQFMDRGQNPKMVVRHDDSPTNPAPDRSVGDIVRIEKKLINGVPFIVGDVEMDRSDFDQLIGSNAFPRRSAEIWQDGFMSEVALLGRQTPRRPLPDTKFSSDEKRGQRACFTRECPRVEFQTNPGAGTVSPPRTEDDDMADDKDMMKQISEMEDEIKRLKDENAKLSEKLKKMQNDRQGDKMTTDDLAAERDKYQRNAEALQQRVATLERDGYKQRLYSEINGGLRVANPEEIVNRIMSADNPDAEFKFITENFTRDPINVKLNAASARPVGPSKLSPEDEAKAARLAQTRANKEGDPSLYKTFYAEELSKLAG